MGKYISPEWYMLLCEYKKSKVLQEPLELSSQT